MNGAANASRPTSPFGDPSTHPAEFTFARRVRTGAMEMNIAKPATSCATITKVYASISITIYTKGRTLVRPDAQPREAQDQVVEAQSGSMAKRYYDLVTDFYEYAWGHSFHFAPRRKNESFAESQRRYQRFVAESIGLKPGMRVLDVGCGIGGPMREIVKVSGAHVVGLNINAYQLAKCERYNRKAGIADRAGLLEGDFMAIPAEDASFDAVYHIGATCHTSDKVGVFSEIFRVLKPGGLFASDEFCLTPAYDAGNPEHRLKKFMEHGASLPDIPPFEAVTEALGQVGFDLLEARDMNAEPGVETPWWKVLEGGEFGLRSLPRGSAGRRITATATWVLEKVGAVPDGTTAVAKMLNEGADGFLGAGRLGIFTPSYYTKARKPETA